ncbi:MAG: hypothetical protein CSA86_06330 [Arcobacter sp.]|nr:MAG: hypothetical protein CSA86_06330 [Arcobacter sp.]
MKKAFTLLEVTISISIFLVLIFFLYKTLDQTKHTNKIFEQKRETLKQEVFLNKLFLEDIAEFVPQTKIKKPIPDKKNNIFIFKSYNTFHNPFYNNITYLVTNTHKLVRIESRYEFNPNFKKQFEKDNFYKNLYIDTILEDIELFKVKLSKDKEEILFVIKQKDKEIQFYKTFVLTKEKPNP